MADEGQRIEVAIAANIRGLIDGLKGATDAVKGATGQMSTQFEALGAKMAGVGKAIAALGAIVAGGKMFKDAIDNTIKWNMEVDKLSRTLGETPQNVSVLKVALHSLGIDTETYLTANRMMIRQINAGGEGFKKLGIDIRDANGNLKPSTELMTEAVEKIRTLKAGTDQQAAGLAVFGRGWAQVADVLRLTKEREEEAREEAEKLHLIVGPDGIAKTREYQEALRKLDLIGEALQTQIGTALMPALLKLGQFFGDIGPGLAMVLSGALKILVTYFYGLKFAIESVVAWVQDFFLKAIEGFKTVGSVMGKLIKGDLSGAIAEAQAGGDRINNITKETVNIQKDLWAGLKKNVAETWNPPAAKVKGPEAPDARFNPDKGKDNSEELLRAFKAQLEEKKAAEENWFTWSVDRELEFWQSKLGETTKGTKAYLAVLAEVNKLRMAKGKEEEAETHARFELEMAQAKEDTAQRVALAKAEAERLKGVWGEKSKHYADALRKIEEEEDRHKEKMKALQNLKAEAANTAALAEVDLKEEEVKLLRDLEVISEQESLRRLVVLEDEKFQIRLKAAQDAAALESDPVKKQEALNHIAEIEQGHRLKVQQLNGQSMMVMKGQFDTYFNGITQGWNGVIQGLIRGTTTWGQAFRSIMGSVTQFFISNAIKMTLEWVRQMLLQKLATLSKAKAELSATAATAGASAADSAAKIPFVGWAIAIGAMAAVVAAVMGLGGNIGSAAGGWDRIPSDQIAQLHKNEMVLPAHLAERVRNMTGDGEGGGAQKGERRSVSITIQAMDGQDVHRVLTKHQDSLFRIFREGGRNGRI